MLRRLKLPVRSALLVAENAHARGLVERLGGQTAKLYEGADVKEPRRWLERALEAEGDPARLARLLVELLDAWGSGVAKSHVTELAAVCTSDGINPGKRAGIRTMRSAGDLSASRTASRSRICVRALRCPIATAS